MKQQMKNKKAGGKQKHGPAGGQKSGSKRGQHAGHAKQHINKKAKKLPHSRLQDLPLPGEQVANQGADSDVELSDEDLDFVAQHSQSLGFLKNLDAKALDKSVKERQKRDVARAAAAGAEDGDEDDDEAAGKPRAPQDDDEGLVGLESYEKAPRTGRADEGPKSKGLPIKTLEGALEYKHEDSKQRQGPKKELAELHKASQVIQVEGITVEDELETALQEQQEEAAQKAQAAAREAAERKKREAAAAAERAVPPALAALASLRSKEQRLAKAREAMAVAANKLLSGPEQAIGEFKVLNALLSDEDKQVSRLAMVTLLAIFKDIAPGYRIRPPTEKELQVKVSKDVQKLRDFEAALLKHYQAYLKALLPAANAYMTANKGHHHSNSSKDKEARQAQKAALAHARVAIKCMSQLLTSLPHFNYSSDLLQALVPHMASSDDQIRVMACGAVRSLLAMSEVQGKLALEAVQLVADLVKNKKCVCPPEIVQVLSVLRFTEVKPPSQDDETDKKNSKKKDKGKDKRPKRSHKDIDIEVEKDFRESEAGPDMKQAARIQSQMLEALFETYFRVLKTCTAAPALQQDSLTANQQQPQPQQANKQPQVKGVHSNPNAKQVGKGKNVQQNETTALEVTGAVAPPLGLPRDRLLAKHPLLYPALEGLGRYAHLISVEYFQDIMEVFHQLLRSPGLPFVERLRVLLTASNILRGQGEALNIDRRELYSQLYSTLLTVPMRGLAELLEHRRSDAENGYAGNALQHDDDNDAHDHPATAQIAAVLHQALQQANSHTTQQQQGGQHMNVSLNTPSEASITHRAEEPAAVLVGAILGQMLCEPKVTDMPRAAAFITRCASLASQSPTPEAMAMLGCCMRLLRRYPRLQSLLDWEGELPVGGKIWSPDCPDPSEAGALSACLWELALLQQHYHPHVAQAAKSIITGCNPVKSADGSTTGTPMLSGPLALPGTLRDLAVAYVPLAGGAYRPAPQQPQGKAKLQAPPKRLLCSPVSEECADLLEQHGVSLNSSSGTSQQDVDMDVDGDDAQQDEDSSIAAGLHQLYRVARRYHDNQQLRQEQRLLVHQIQRFQVHLHQKQQQEQLQRQQRQQQQKLTGKAQQQDAAKNQSVKTAGSMQGKKRPAPTQTHQREEMRATVKQKK